MGRLQFDVANGLESLAQCADEMRALADRADVPASARWESIEPWLRNRPAVAPLVVRVREGQRTVGIGVFAATRRRGVVRIRLAGESGEPGNLLYDGHDALGHLSTAVAAALRRRTSPWVMRLTGLPPDGTTARALARELGSSTIGAGFCSPRLDVGDSHTAATVLSRNTRAAVAKARNRITADGRSLRLSWVRRSDEVASHLDEIVSIRARRNDELGRAEGVDDAELSTFVDTVLAHSRASRANVLLAHIDDVAAAYAVCLESSNEAWVYSNAVSPDFLRYSAGTIANAEVVTSYLAEPRIHFVNWGAGIQRYKMSGPVSLQCATELTAWSSPTVRALEGLSHRTTHHLRRSTGSHRPPPAD